MIARGPIAFADAAMALFRLDGPTAVSAGAGSGKTTALVELCVRLLSGEATGEPCDPGALIAITFTERAAEELVDRLREAVAARAREAVGAEGLAAGSTSRAEVSASTRRAGSDGAQAWLDRLDGLERMPAGTIHSFCARLLREHALEAGLDPELKVVDEERASAWLTEAARAAVVAALDEGRPAARQLVAGMGVSGYGGLSALVADLVCERSTRGDGGGVVVEKVDEAALREAWERLGEAAGGVTSLARGSRTAGAGQLLDRIARAWVELEAGVEGDSAPSKLDALEEATYGPKLAAKGDEPLRRARDRLRELAVEVSRLEAERLAAPQREELARLVEDAGARYTGRKKEARCVDFDDLLVKARDLLLREPALLEELKGRFRALLVDEYQDVNGLQQEIFGILGGDRSGPILVAVGDLKQSIYRFRGADVSVFARLVRRFASGEGRVLRLSENYRSVSAVLELVNEISARSMALPAGIAPRDDEIQFGEDDKLVPRRGEGSRPACEILVDDRGGRAAERRVREAEAIARRIRSFVSGEAGVAIPARGNDGAGGVAAPRYGDVGILFRRLTQIGPYERALRSAGIPYRLARGGGFYQAPEVRDLGELLAALFDPSDVTAWAALLRSPACAVSDSTLVLLARLGFSRLARLTEAEIRMGLEASIQTTTTTPTSTSTPTSTTTPTSTSTSTQCESSLSPREAGGEGRGEGGDLDAASAPASIPEDEWDRLLRFLSVYRELRTLRDRLPIAELLGRAIEALDLDAALIAGPDGERRAMNLEKALALASRFEAGGGRPQELARHLRILADRPPKEPEADFEPEDAVAILTIHQAKGLEWPIVFVPDLGYLPRNDSRRALIDAEGRLCSAWFDLPREEHVDTASMRSAKDSERRSLAAESRRLLYVALTRARDRLVLSGEARGKGDSWRGLVEAADEARPDLVLRVPFERAGELVIGDPLPSSTSGPESAASSLGPPILARPAQVSAISVAVTDLAEYARCPRRHHLARVLRLPEPRGERAMTGDDPGRATSRGTLAHALLAESDLAAPPLQRLAQMKASAARRGYDPSSSSVRRILAEVGRFSESEGGRALATAARDGRLSREVPFLLELEGGPSPGSSPDGAEPRRGATRDVPAAFVSGTMDALIEDPGREGLVVIDYKYAAPRPGSVERYRFQLLAYALAARRAHPGAKVRARLQFLRGDFRMVDVTPTDPELEAFALEAPRMAHGAYLGAGGEIRPSELGRDEARCRAEGCGYTLRCFPPSRGR